MAMTFVGVSQRTRQPVSRVSPGDRGISTPGRSLLRESTGGAMGDNFRWLLALSAASVTIAVVVSAHRHPAGRTRARCALGVGSLLIAWAASELPPFVAWTSGGWTDLATFVDSAASPQVLVACAAYFGIVMASSRGLIGMPIYRQVQARAGELRGIIDTGFFEATGGQRLELKITQAERFGARCIGRFV